MYGTVNTFKPETKKEIPTSMLLVTEGVCAAYGGTCELKYMSGYPVTINSVTETAIFTKAVIDLLSEENIIRNPKPSMGEEDSSYMLEDSSGCYVLLAIDPKKA